MSSDVRETCLCSKCGKVAAEFAAFRAGEATGFMANREHLLRTGWFGELLRPAAYESAVALLEKIRAGELIALAKDDPDMFGFFCRKCCKSYCTACWQIGPPEFDDGFYDCTRGTCPEGHEQVLDD